jgi:hypothetical protein
MINRLLNVSLKQTEEQPTLSPIMQFPHMEAKRQANVGQHDT